MTITHPDQIAKERELDNGQEIRRIMLPLRKEFKARWPEVF